MDNAVGNYRVIYALDKNGRFVAREGNLRASREQMTEASYVVRLQRRFALPWRPRYRQA